MEVQGQPLELGAGPPLIYQWHYRLTEHLFTLTHEYSISSHFKGTKDISIHTRSERHLSLCSKPALPTSLYMYKLNIGSDMHALISCACFIRGVDQETFFPWHFEQANTILHRLREGKIPFVLCQHKQFNLRLSLLSKQPISSEARRDTGNACGSFNRSLISRGTPHSAWPLCFISRRGHA